MNARFTLPTVLLLILPNWNIFGFFVGFGSQHISVCRVRVKRTSLHYLMNRVGVAPNKSSFTFSAATHFIPFVCRLHLFFSYNSKGHLHFARVCTFVPTKSRSPRKNKDHQLVVWNIHGLALWLSTLFHRIENWTFYLISSMWPIIYKLLNGGRGMRATFRWLLCCAVSLTEKSIFFVYWSAVGGLFSIFLALSRALPLSLR